MGGGNLPAFRYETVYDSVEIVPLAQGNRFSERSALERASGLVPSKQLSEFSKVWLGLPTWNMLDGSRRPASFVFHVSETGIRDRRCLFEKTSSVLT